MSDNDCIPYQPAFEKSMQIADYKMALKYAFHKRANSYVQIELGKAQHLRGIAVI